MTLIINKIEFSIEEMNKVIKEHNSIYNMRMKKQYEIFEMLEKHYAAEFAKEHDSFPK
ncbi:hypothetical protein [Thermosipho africanus]|uniref:hypothetical protein n=1 Tax=Thermosipho africanus TaxID=2421 RepID=UPI001472DD10|nr:hypothetical protein [Thermosipho africanus]